MIEPNEFDRESKPLQDFLRLLRKHKDLMPRSFPLADEDWMGVDAPSSSIKHFREQDEKIATQTTKKDESSLLSAIDNVLSEGSALDLFERGFPVKIPYTTMLNRVSKVATKHFDTVLTLHGCTPTPHSYTEIGSTNIVDVDQEKRLLLRYRRKELASGLCMLIFCDKSEDSSPLFFIPRLKLRLDYWSFSTHLRNVIGDRFDSSKRWEVAVVPANDENRKWFSNKRIRDFVENASEAYSDQREAALAFLDEKVVE